VRRRTIGRALRITGFDPETLARRWVDEVQVPLA
jgi:hypothetical protein